MMAKGLLSPRFGEWRRRPRVATCPIWVDTSSSSSTSWIAWRRDDRSIAFHPPRLVSPWRSFWRRSARPRRRARRSRTQPRSDMNLKSINYWSYPGGLEGTLPVFEFLEKAKTHGYEAVELC